ncbi:hypothetical protein DFS34DRAFT_654925 [Phlyctochytrium arcticum]|nr:hypothetical protein DFS34DRAFT_654925 [Phlyctochytrium arcticum]
MSSGSDSEKEHTDNHHLHMSDHEEDFQDATSSQAASPPTTGEGFKPKNWFYDNRATLQCIAPTCTAIGKYNSDGITATSIALNAVSATTARPSSMSRLPWPRCRPQEPSVPAATRLSTSRSPPRSQETMSPPLLDTPEPEERPATSVPGRPPTKPFVPRKPTFRIPEKTARASTAPPATNAPPFKFTAPTTTNAPPTSTTTTAPNAPVFTAREWSARYHQTHPHHASLDYPATR